MLGDFEGIVTEVKGRRLTIDDGSGNTVISYVDRARGLELMPDNTIRVKGVKEPADFIPTVEALVIGKINPLQPKKLLWYADLNYYHLLQEEI